MDSTTDTFVWFELETDDVDRAIDFYTNVIPWGTSQWQREGEEPYEMFTVDELTTAGVMELPEEAKAGDTPPMWLGYIGTNELESKLEQLETAGGARESEIIDIGEAGRFAVVSDPTGGVFALHQATSMENGEMPEQNRPGAFSWLELRTDDVDAAWNFYSEMFGWEAGDRMEFGEGMPYQMFGWDGRDRGGISAMPTGTEMPANWLFYVTVEDMDAAVERVDSEGGELLHGPMEVPGGDWIAHCKDPQGALFALQLPARRED